MYPPESTSSPASGSKGKYSANIVLQDLEEDDEKSLASNLNETNSDDSDNSESESDKSPTPTQQIATPKESEGTLERIEGEVRSPIYMFMSCHTKNLNLVVPQLHHITKIFTDNGIAIKTRTTTS